MQLTDNTIIITRMEQPWCSNTHLFDRHSATQI
jgi:hypothetical protein